MIRIFVHPGWSTVRTAPRPEPARTFLARVDCHRTTYRNGTTTATTSAPLPRPRLHHYRDCTATTSAPLPRPPRHHYRDRLSNAPDSYHLDTTPALQPPRHRDHYRTAPSPTTAPYHYHDLDSTTTALRPRPRSAPRPQQHSNHDHYHNHNSTTPRQQRSPQQTVSSAATTSVIRS